jgi:hypothetical protein
MSTSHFLNIFRSIIVLSIITLFVGCGGSGGGGNSSGTAEETGTISGRILDSRNNPVAGATVTISSSTPVVVTTDQNGAFTAQVPSGNHTITASKDNVTFYQGTFNAQQGSQVSLGDLTPTTPYYPGGVGITLSSIQVTPANPSISPSATQQFIATGSYSDNSSKDISTSVTWNSNNSGVATINNTGLATAAGAGSTTITASSGNVSGSTLLTVTGTNPTPVPNLVSITVTPVNQNICVGTQLQFTATGHYSDNTTKDLSSSVTWNSSLTGAATINSAGNATTVGAGTTTITATSGNISGYTQLTVGAPPSAPTGTKATSGDNQVTITWNAVTGATSYTLYWSNSPGVSKATPNKISTLYDNSYTHTGLTNGTPYYYVITASDTCGESPVSNEASATPVETDPLLGVTPSFLAFDSSKVTGNITISNDGAGTLTWWVNTGSEPWLGVAPTYGTCTTEEDTVIVTVDRTGQGRGLYSGNIYITSTGGNETVPVYMSVPNHAPHITSSPSTVAALNQDYTYDVNASDLDNDTLT